MDPGFFDSNSSSSELQYQYDQTLDVGLGATILVLSLVGVSFNIIVMLTVRGITKRNCSKARLASSLFIFHLSISDTIYSTVHLFTAISMVIGCREKGVPDNMAMFLFSNLVGIFFNLTIRTSLWFLTMITIVRCLAVRFPLKISSIITKRRVQVVAGLVWGLIFIISTIPYTMNVHYQYSKPLAISTWNMSANNHTFEEVLWFHILLMVLPIFIPGVMITSLYLLIVHKVIQLKTVHHKIRIGNIDKAPHQGPAPPPHPAPPPSPRRIFPSMSAISTSLTFLRRPLSLHELERVEKETEAIDEDLMDFAVSALDNLNSNTSNKSGLIAYYINRFIVKTAGSESFERIQSNSFTEKRTLHYEAEECPVSLNYYDCKEREHRSGWYLRRHSEPVTSSAGKESDDVTKRFRFRLGRSSMGSVVKNAMKLKDTKEKGSSPNSTPSPPNTTRKTQSQMSFKLVAARCTSNTITEECTNTTMEECTNTTTEECTNATMEECTNTTMDECTDTTMDQCTTTTMEECTEDTVIEAASISAPYSISCTDNTCRLRGFSSDTTTNQTSTSRVPEEKSNGTKRKSVLKHSMSVPANVAMSRNRSQSEPVVLPLVNKQSSKSRFPAPIPNTTAQKRLQDKRINRLDRRLQVIIQSAFYTLLMISLFVVCYMPWWLLSVDIICRMLQDKGSPFIDVTFTRYCNLLTISYGTILCSACSNPVIYFYFAYKQAMLDNFRLKYAKLLGKRALPTGPRK